MTHDSTDSYEADVERARTPMGRAIMRVLSERGHYVETPEDFEWAQVDAGVTVRFIEERGLTIRNVYDALLDTGLHGAPCPCLQADVEAIGACYLSRWTVCGVVALPRRGTL